MMPEVFIIASNALLSTSIIAVMLIREISQELLKLEILIEISTQRVRLMTKEKKYYLFILPWPFL